MSCTHDKHKCNCYINPGVPESMVQSLDEVQYQNGIWFAISQIDQKASTSLLTAFLNKWDSRTQRDWVLRTDHTGGTPIAYAAKRGNRDVVSKIIQLGGACPEMINVQSPGAKMTALHRAAGMLHVDVVKMLLACGADKTLRDSNGKSPFDYVNERLYETAMDRNRDATDATRSELLNLLAVVLVDDNASDGQKDDDAAENNE